MVPKGRFPTCTSDGSPIVGRKKILSQLHLSQTSEGHFAALAILAKDSSGDTTAVLVAIDEDRR